MLLQLWWIILTTALCGSINLHSTSNEWGFPLLHILVKTLLAILVGVWWHCTMVLISIFLNTNEVEHFLCLLLLGYPLLWKPFEIPSLFFYWSVFIFLIYRKFFICSEYKPFIGYMFSSSTPCLFTYIIVWFFVCLFVCLHKWRMLFLCVIYFWLCWVFVAVRGLLIAVASLYFGARALGTRASVVVARGLSSCGSQALQHRFSSCGTRA